MFKYKTSKWNLDIEQVEVFKETKKCVWGKFWRDEICRESKFTNYHGYHDTWGEAYAYLVVIQRKRVKSAEEVLRRAEKSLLKLKNMAEPKENK